MTDGRRRPAVVLGGSMAGLLAARVLADHYDRVIVIDRDPLTTTVRHRRGVPQDRHLHGLHPRGLQILTDLFDGISDELRAAGAAGGDMLADCRYLLSGHRFRQAPIGLRGLLCSRPLLESRVRARVGALPQVRFLTCAVTGVTSSADRARITGVRVRPSGDEERTMAADLVVDATGRGSRTPDWLDALGYSPPVEDRVPIGLGYATRTVRLRPDALDGDVLVICGGTPENPRTGFLAAQEDGRHVVTLSGILGDHPPTDLAGFAAFAASLTFPDIADALVGAQAMDDGVTFRFPASVRRRYERLPAFPAGLLVTGDALCSFNPVYGQGMTVAAMQAELLARELTAGPVPDPHRWFPGAARVVDAPWQVAVGADLAFPGVAGRRTAQVRMVNSYLPRLHAAARTDPTLGAAFVRVVGLLERPESLLRPDRVARVGWARLWAGPACPAPPGSARMDRERPAPIGGQR
jgi:2-polyprenyl-6-methoxyphenol hydroxylase-like FAD-dependent oxidoreductase